MKRHRPTITFQPALEKLPAFGRLGTVRQFCQAADFWGTGLPSGRPGRGRNKAFHNPAHAAAVIPDWPANPGLYSSRAVGVSWRKTPETSPFLCAIFSPAGRSNSFGALSPLATVTCAARKSVFTRTQLTPRFNIFALVFCEGTFRNLAALNQKFSDTGRCLRVKAQAAQSEGLSKSANILASQRSGKVN